MIVETTYLFLKDELKKTFVIVLDVMYNNVVDNDTKIVDTVLITQNFVVH